MTNAFQYVIKNQGIDSDEAYPYVAEVSFWDNACLKFHLSFNLDYNSSAKRFLFSVVNANTTHSTGLLTARATASYQRGMSLHWGQL